LKLKLKSAEIEAPEDALGTAVHIKKKFSGNDALIVIDFEEIHDNQTIYSDDLSRISVLPPDHVCVSESGKILVLAVSEEELPENRAQRTKVVEVLMAPTQVLGALDVPNTEGHTVLMYASTHGLSRVVDLLLDSGANPHHLRGEQWKKNPCKRCAKRELLVRLKLLSYQNPPRRRDYKTRGMFFEMWCKSAQLLKKIRLTSAHGPQWIEKMKLTQHDFSEILKEDFSKNKCMVLNAQQSVLCAAFVGETAKESAREKECIMVTGLAGE